MNWGQDFCAPGGGPPWLIRHAARGRQGDRGGPGGACRRPVPAADTILPPGPGLEPPGDDDSWVTTAEPSHTPRTPCPQRGGLSFRRAGSTFSAPSMTVNGNAVNIAAAGSLGRLEFYWAVNGTPTWHPRNGRGRGQRAVTRDDPPWVEIWPRAGLLEASTVR